MSNLNQLARSVLITLVLISTYSCSTMAAVAENQQSITFYEHLNCEGESFTFEDTNFDLFQHWVTNSTSYYVNGTWHVHMLVTENPAFVWKTLIHSIGTCENTFMGTNVIRLERYGPSLLDTPEITLFADQELSGIRIPANETGMSFERPIMTQSFMFTGVHEWTIFEGINFEGNSLCLSATDRVKKVGYGFTYNWYQNIPMGSIKYGCSTDEDDSSTESNSQSSVHSNIMTIISLPLALFCLIMKI